MCRHYLTVPSLLRDETKHSRQRLLVSCILEKKRKKKKEDLIIIMIKNVIRRSRDDGAYHQVRYRQSLIKLIPARKQKMDADSRGEKKKEKK
uniref:Uncharacterized protein n=1 Tax=Daphnia galeata TaxID=27404 RepID=A0A8J2WLK5_9CRUS|nr:unnamed protein product [Daphnia galeata]